jgi:hypothetical protein
LVSVAVWRGRQSLAARFAFTALAIVVFSPFRQQLWQLCKSGSKVPRLIARKYCADRSPAVFEINVAQRPGRSVNCNLMREMDIR